MDVEPADMEAEPPSLGAETRPRDEEADMVEMRTERRATKKAKAKRSSDPRGVAELTCEIRLLSGVLEEKGHDDDDANEYNLKGLVADLRGYGLSEATTMQWARGEFNGSPFLVWMGPRALDEVERARCLQTASGRRTVEPASNEKARVQLEAAMAVARARASKGELILLEVPRRLRDLPLENFPGVVRFSADRCAYGGVGVDSLGGVAFVPTDTELYSNCTPLARSLEDVCVGGHDHELAPNRDPGQGRHPARYEAAVLRGVRCALRGAAGAVDLGPGSLRNPRANAAVMLGALDAGPILE